MDLRTVQQLFRYNTWANTRMLQLASRLSLDQFKRELGGSFPSVQAAVTHIVWAEWLWLERWTGSSPQEVFKPADFPSLSVLKDRWSPIQTAQVQFIDSLTRDRLNQVVPYVNMKNETWEYVLWEQMYHLVNHSSYHRGQVTNMFRQLGIVPRTMDFLNYRDEMG